MLWSKVKSKNFWPDLLRQKVYIVTDNETECVNLYHYGIIFPSFILFLGIYLLYFFARHYFSYTAWLRYSHVCTYSKLDSNMSTKCGFLLGRINMSLFIYVPKRNATVAHFVLFEFVTLKETRCESIPKKAEIQSYK